MEPSWCTKTLQVQPTPLAGTSGREGYGRDTQGGLREDAGWHERLHSDRTLIDSYLTQFPLHARLDCTSMTPKLHSSGNVHLKTALLPVVRNRLRTPRNSSAK